MARLPIPYQDLDWGPILNQYLLQTHKDDGSLKDKVVGTAQLQPASVTPDKLAPEVLSQMPKIHVGPTPPTNPQNGDIWFDISGSTK